MKILVTGGAGFIGSHLCERLLAKNHKIVVIDNFDEFYSYKIKLKNILESTNNIEKYSLISEFFQSNLSKDQIIRESLYLIENENYKLYYNDIRDFSELEKIFKEEKPELIINLAGLAGVRPSLERPLEYEEVNIKGYMNLLELCKKFDIKKFIQASSSSVYGNNKKVPFSELDSVDYPISPYASTKKSCELIGYTYSKLYSISMLQLRFFTVYGERQRPDLAIHKFTKQILNGEKVSMYGDGKTYRDYTYVGDIVEGIEKGIDYLIKNKGIYEILNLGNSNTISLKDMIEMIEKELNIKAEVLSLPMQSGDVIRTFADISKAEKMIGYRPKMEFKEGIKRFITWYKKENEI
ncbi:GDP-mannose 4,6-dehydratase [Fusobacterium sp.]|uniref:GDP-mannose 4,6-dehydratase n=1 Tax=Fusobacterium sp. TaxID=68766 RepID=UPI0025BD77C8|nr:GDP-mannose 4,6-dehydratase [Fusobacterium sp.]